MYTVPPAIKDSGCAIVYGHGVFAAGKETFQGALDMLAGIEDKSRKEYFRTVRSLLKHLLDRDPYCLAERM